MKRNREKSRCVFFLVSWAVLQIPAIAMDPGYHDKFPAKKIIQLPGNVALELMRIPGGIFQMGSPESERSRDSDEGPMHTVTIGHDFYMGKYEVTQAQWKAVMHDWMTTVSQNKMRISGSTPARHYGVGDQYPVYYISWEDCQAFISKLNQIGQGTFRLPSEAEWEYACRAGKPTRFYFGESTGCRDDFKDCAAGTMAGNRTDYMWYSGNNDLPGQPGYGNKVVGQKKPNDFGLHDMHGNVWEWCQDTYHPYYRGAPTDGSAWETQASNDRVLRGGGWGYPARKCRSAYRDRSPPGPPHNRSIADFGLRLVWTE